MLKPTSIYIYILYISTHDLTELGCLWIPHDIPGLVNIQKTMERSTMFNGQINYFDWAMFNSKVSKITSNYQRVTMKPWQFPNSQHLPHLPPSFWGSQGPLYDSLKLTSQRHDNVATGRPKWFFGPTKYHLNPWNHLWLLMVHENISCKYLYTYIYIYFF